MTKCKMCSGAEKLPMGREKSRRSVVEGHDLRRSSEVHGGALPSGLFSMLCITSTQCVLSKNVL